MLTILVVSAVDQGLSQLEGPENGKAAVTATSVSTTNLTDANRSGVKRRGRTRLLSARCQGAL